MIFSLKKYIFSNYRYVNESRNQARAKTSSKFVHCLKKKNFYQNNFLFRCCSRTALAAHRIEILTQKWKFTSQLASLKLLSLHGLSI